jgi:hypothetical protein
MRGRAGVRLGRIRGEENTRGGPPPAAPTECSSCRTKGEPGGRRKVDPLCSVEREDREQSNGADLRAALQLAS